MGGHSFGRAHPEISGYAGPWTPVPGHFTNQFAKKLVSDSWKLVDKNMVDKSGDLITGLKPRGMRRQYVNKDGEGELMALVSDMAMFHDAEFGPWVRTYAKDFTRLKKDFGLAFKYMTEAGFQAPKEKSVFGKLIQQICTFRYDIPSYMDSCMATMFGSCWDGFTDMSAGPAKLAPDAPKVGKPYTMEEIAKHNTKEDTWVLINGVVCDVTKFKNEHPGGVDIIMQNAGTDVSSLWNTIHNPEAVKKIAPDTMIGYLA
jgi:predicted heme/steroid binding protein